MILTGMGAQGRGSGSMRHPGPHWHKRVAATRARVVGDDNSFRRGLTAPQSLVVWARDLPTLS